MSITMRIEPIDVDGKQVFTIRQFSAIIEKSDQTVLSLINKGNKVRKLKVVRVERTPFVLASELTDFPFTCSGKGDDIYHYNKEGAIDYEKSELS